MQTISYLIATELGVREPQVQAAMDLLDSGATVPFVARYRKEATDGLDDVALRALELRLAYLRDLAARRLAVCKAIDAQGKLTAPLRQAINDCTTQQELEDLYLPFKLKRRSKGEIAREAGLEPLAEALFADLRLIPLDEAAAFVVVALPPVDGAPVSTDFSTPLAVLDGVRDILSECWAEQASLVQGLREWLWTSGVLQSRLRTGKDENHPDVAKFRDYFDYSEPIRQVPSHRALAVFRARTLEVLEVKLVLPDAMPTAPLARASAPSPAEARIAHHLGWSHQARAGDDFLRKCVAWTWRVKLELSIERELLSRLRAQAQAVAIQVFADNLRDLLLTAPAGPRVVMGLDPGIRSGVKVAVVDSTGKLLATTTVYPHEPRRDWAGALQALDQLCRAHAVELIAIGNGTASRETDKLAAELIARLVNHHPPQRVVVSEAGASVYSASAFATQEMPDVDVSLRGAASIARRLQDPLAELVKIDPKAIGVGQYQHDVHQGDLARSLDSVVEDCVNAVGVDLNTASAPLLARVSGLSATVAASVVGWRDTHGGFRNRQQLLLVPGLGARTFEQSAGFLRIRGGDNPLDMTGVHPETYPVAQSILLHTGLRVDQLMGHPELLLRLRPDAFATATVGVVTVQDILGELEKTGRDPRPVFQAARLNDGVHDIRDLREGMLLEGTVSNVAAFGAFVDIGVHQDGLVHLSQLSDRFVTDAREVVQTGLVVKVRVLEVDLLRKRISLSMKPAGKPGARSASGAPRFEAASRQQRHGEPPLQPAASTAMASAFAKLAD